MLAKNQINRNKTDNKAKSDNKNLDFMPFIQNNINGHIEWEQIIKTLEPLEYKVSSVSFYVQGVKKELFYFLLFKCL